MPKTRGEVAWSAARPWFFLPRPARRGDFGPRRAFFRACSGHRRPPRSDAAAGRSSRVRRGAGTSATRAAADDRLRSASGEGAFDDRTRDLVRVWLTRDVPLRARAHPSVRRPWIGVAKAGTASVHSRPHVAVDGGSTDPAITRCRAPPIRAHRPSSRFGRRRQGARARRTRPPTPPARPGALLKFAKPASDMPPNAASDAPHEPPAAACHGCRFTEVQPLGQR